MRSNTSYEFSATWGVLTKVITAAVSILLITVVLIPVFTEPVQDKWFYVIMTIIPVGVIPGGSLFMIRGFRIENESLYVKRLLWETKVSLKGLKSAEHDPNATKGSWRVFGNGGFFGFSGLYRNRALGNYRAFITNFPDSVVLRFEKSVVVISPSDPAKAAEVLNSMIN